MGEVAVCVGAVRRENYGEVQAAEEKLEKEDRFPLFLFSVFPVELLKWHGVVKGDERRTLRAGRSPQLLMGIWNDPIPRGRLLTLSDLTNACF